VATKQARPYERQSFKIMKTKHLLALLVTCCAVAALTGCASTDPQMSASSMDEKNLERDEALSPTGLSQPVILDERAFLKRDIETNGAVSLEEWRRHFDTNTGPKENFSTLDENHDGQINFTEFLTQAPKYPKLYSAFGNVGQINQNDFSWDEQEFQPQGLRLFSIRF